MNDPAFYISIGSLVLSAFSIILTLVYRSSLLAVQKKMKEIAEIKHARESKSEVFVTFKNGVVWIEAGVTPVRDVILDLPQELLDNYRKPDLNIAFIPANSDKQIKLEGRSNHFRTQGTKLLSKGIECSIEWTDEDGNRHKEEVKLTT